MHNKFAKSYLPSSSSAAGIPVPVRELHAGHRAVILQHFLLLNDNISSTPYKHLIFKAQTTTVLIY